MIKKHRVFPVLFYSLPLDKTSNNLYDNCEIVDFFETEEEPLWKSAIWSRF